MTEWKKYEGTHEQVSEMWNAENGFVYRNKKGEQSERLSQFYYHDTQNLIDNNDICGVTHYLICNPHPLADMIIRQAQTGQPVYYRPKGNHNVTGAFSKMEDMRWNDTRHWEYSFTPFED